ncbi:hypothetical protein [Halorubrum halophilum]|uniref:hypothetical protein n=1 Tax=Halorubrum halophilum TaxID=413816 RepID=UPI00186B2C68|nr:hypothetical protein [Halorubrum halophilum]
MSAVPMAGTGRGPRPDPTTFTRRAIEQFDGRGDRADETTDRPESTAPRFDDDATTESH